MDSETTFIRKSLSPRRTRNFVGPIGIGHMMPYIRGCPQAQPAPEPSPTGPGADCLGPDLRPSTPQYRAAKWQEQGSLAPFECSLGTRRMVAHGPTSVCSRARALNHLPTHPWPFDRNLEAQATVPPAGVAIYGRG